MTHVAYLASHGEYSDYAVAAIFDTKERAEAWVAAREYTSGCPVCDGTGHVPEVKVRHLNAEERQEYARMFLENRGVVIVDGVTCGVDEAVGLARIQEPTGETRPCCSCKGTGKYTYNEYSVEEFPLNPEPEVVP